MEKTREKNPIKEVAMQLAHQMEREAEIKEGFLSPRLEEEIIEYGNRLRNDIIKKGFNIDMLLHYAEEYKSLTWDNYFEWLYV